MIEIIILSFWFSQQVFPAIAQDEERAVCDCLNPFDVIAVALARHLFFGALPILGDVPEVRGDIAQTHQHQKLMMTSHKQSFTLIWRMRKPPMLLVSGSG